MGGCRAPGNRRDARCACMVISLKKDVARSTERRDGNDLKIARAAIGRRPGKPL